MGQTRRPPQFVAAAGDPRLVAWPISRPNADEPRRAIRDKRPVEGVRVRNRPRWAMTRGSCPAIEDCFQGFLPKPSVVIDDQRLADWRRIIAINPFETSGKDLSDCEDLLSGR